MRRCRQQLSARESVEILEGTTAGVLALCGNDMCPYGVPMSHVYSERKLYFHCAVSGHKLDILGQNPMASFTVIGRDEIHPEKFTTYYRSVVAFGKIRIVGEEREKRRLLEMIGRRCNPDDAEALSREIEGGIKRCNVLEMDIERLTGKQAIELVKGSSINSQNK